MADGERRTYLEDCDSDENPVEETRTYPASTVASSTIKERSNVGRMRKDSKARRTSASPATNPLAHTDSDSTAHPGSPLRRESSMRSKGKSREKEETRPVKKVTVKRPPHTHSKTTPVIQTSASRRPHDEPSYYGVNPVTTSASTSSRPRAYTSNQRPASYYGSSPNMSPNMSRPPVSNTRYWPPQPQHQQPFGSFPPQAPYPPPGAIPFASPHMLPPSPLGPPPGDYFGPSPRQLADRFSLRPRSSAGHRLSSSTYVDDYEQENDGGALLRRPSLARKTRGSDEDQRCMPPPPRPRTTRPKSMQSSPFPTPTTHHRGSFDCDDESYDDEDSVYNGASPMTRYDYSNYAPRRPSVDSNYDSGHYVQTEVASKKSRRSSMYGPRGVPPTQDKLKSAMGYQEEVEGGPTPMLTAEALRKVNKTPSRSTKSTASRDESGYIRSNTTRTSVDNDDINIIVKGTATLKVGNAEMECRDGAEINISSRSNGGTVRGNSDNADSTYDGGRRGRIDRLPERTRASSQASTAGYYAPPPAPYLDMYSRPFLPLPYAPPFDHF